MPRQKVHEKRKTHKTETNIKRGRERQGVRRFGDGVSQIIYGTITRTTQTMKPVNQKSLS